MSVTSKVRAMTQFSPLWPDGSKTESIPTPETMLLTIILIWLILSFMLAEILPWVMYGIGLMPLAASLLVSQGHSFSCYQTGCSLNWITFSLLGGWDQRSRSFKIIDQQFANFLVPGPLYTVKSFGEPQKVLVLWVSLCRTSSFMSVSLSYILYHTYVITYFPLKCYLEKAHENLRDN